MIISGLGFRVHGWRVRRLNEEVVHGDDCCYSMAYRG